jgi:hypothetical protein
MTAEEYREAAGALAHQTKMPAAAAARMEQRLLAAMRSAQSGQAPPVSRRPAGQAWRSLVAAAASIALILAAVSMWQTILGDGRDAAVPPSAPAVPVMQAIASLPPPGIDLTLSHSGKRMGPTPSPREVAVTPSGFVALPWTAGLPAFESGEIVRMEVQVASLPAYGIDISSGADRPVEADILIGQDGLARAIRLVTNTVRSTQ